MDSNSGSGHGGEKISIGKMSSSLSEMTDSNKESSADDQGGSSNGRPSSNKEMNIEIDISLAAREEINSKADSSVSSTAAVVSAIGSGEHDHRHTSIVFTTDRKHKHRKKKEKTSLDKGFKLSHQEVFLASNVPQLIASPAGRIVACNDFFYKATGLTQKDVKRLTIFSIVKVDKLSYMFDIVANALRSSNSSSVVTKSDKMSSSSSSAQNSNDTSLDKNDSMNEQASCEQDKYQTVTLPCVPFPKEILIAGKGEKQRKDLYMNVTFMYDQNPSKRCIHCALTDTPGSEGKIGTVTKDLLSLLFSGKSDRVPPS